jgi:E3 ubiquitin-protein ligase RFWD2
MKETPYDQLEIYNHRLSSNIDDIQNYYFEWRLKYAKKDALSSENFPPEHNSFSNSLINSSKHSGFETLATLYYADNVHNFTTPIVSSIDFDKDDEHFATAGVTKKIKIYDYNAVVEKDRANYNKFITGKVNSETSQFQVYRYPIREMTCPSKIRYW